MFAKVELTKELNDFINQCKNHNESFEEIKELIFISEMLKRNYSFVDQLNIKMQFQGMKINMIEFQKLIELYKTKDENDIQNKEIIIAEINSEIRNLEKEDLKLLHSCLVNINTEKLNILHSILERVCK